MEVMHVANRILANIYFVQNVILRDISQYKFGDIIVLTKLIVLEQGGKPSHRVTFYIYFQLHTMFQDLEF